MTHKWINAEEETEVEEEILATSPQNVIRFTALLLCSYT